jgi:hypothetical protein
LIVTFADKAAVRDHIACVVGQQYLPGLYFLLDDPKAFHDIELPRACVVKPTHGSGVAIVVSDSAPADARLAEPEGSWVYCHVRPDTVSTDRLVALAQSWTAQLYGQGPNREWAYGHIPRRILVEELLVAADGGIPDDYKFFVFDGQCHYIQVDRGRFETRTQDFFTVEWRHLPLSGGPSWAEFEIASPDRLPEMIDVAQRLGADNDFVRVDMYLLPDRIVVGELTSYPAGGDSPFDPELFNLEFGRNWKVPRRYR